MSQIFLNVILERARSLLTIFQPPILPLLARSQIATSMPVVEKNSLTDGE